MILNDYVTEYNKYKKIYGDNTIVVMQVGSFYEIYAIKNLKTGEISKSNLEEIAKRFELKIGVKEKCGDKIDNHVMIMIGFQNYNKDKYLEKFCAAGYTVAVISQEFEGPGSPRTLECILSPGTYFSQEQEIMSNIISCFWIFYTTFNNIPMLVIGISSIDIFTCKVNCFEYEIEYIDSPTTFDELERFNSINPANECIIISNLEDEKLKNIIPFSGIKSKSIHLIDLNDKENQLSIDANKCESQVFQDEILSYCYGDSYTFSSELYKYGICGQSLCFLLNFINNHNQNLIKKISEPTFENKISRMVLANHSLKQLNMIDVGDYSGPYSSVTKLLNQCDTIMGKRRFHYNLLHPITNIDELNNQYNMIEHLLKSDYTDIYNVLKNIKDLEKISRKMLLKKITPQQFYFIYENLNDVIKIIDNIKLDDKLLNYMDKTDFVIEGCNEIKNILENTFDFDICKNVDSLTFDEKIIKSSYNPELYDKIKSYDESLKKMKSIHEYLCMKLKNTEKNSKTTDYVKLHETEKSGFSFILTNKRSATLKAVFKKENIEIVNLQYEYDNVKVNFEFNVKEINFNSFNKTTDIIVSSQISQIFSIIKNNKFELKDIISRLYFRFIDEFKSNTNTLEHIIKYIIDLDVILCKRKISKKYNYCKPKIIKKNNGYFNAKELRHCLIEHLQKKELYVTNDITFDSEMKSIGTLLYGTNAVGKTSLIKSIGITIIMAQSGMFVPATSLEYSPYEYIFTRILGNDNIFKGLSTFEVEMTELRTILKLCNNKSLILGDELCSGTESNSALGIFVSGIQEFHKKQTNFIFATHFHEITKYEEINNLDNLNIKHLEVFYDSNEDKLIYNRKLKDGPGNNMYGLEVCKSLKLPNEFLENANLIRNKYDKNKINLLELKKSRYSSDKLVSLCEICKKNKGCETHHLQFQKNANDNGYINTTHKNHPGNLISICEECHDKIHKENKEMKRVKTSNGYDLFLN